ncbi:MAG: hypothetical protein AAGD05_14275 [Bacteroidota bacterium]
MLDKLFESFGGDVINQITEKAGISADQAKAALPIAQDSLQSGLMEQISGGNIAGLLGMFNSGGGDGLLNNPIFSGIKAKMMEGVMTKLGLPESVAGLVAGTGMSSVIGNLTSQFSGDGGQVDENSLMSGLGLNSGGGLMDMASNLAKDKLGDMAKDKLGGLGDIAGGLFGK